MSTSTKLAQFCPMSIQAPIKTRRVHDCQPQQQLSKPLSLISCRPGQPRLQRVFSMEASALDTVSSNSSSINGDIPTVKIDNLRDSFATVVTMKFGDKIPHPLDTMATLRGLGLNIVRAKFDNSDPDSRNRFYVTDATTSEKILKSGRIEEIRLTVLSNLMKFHPETSKQLNSAHRVRLPKTRDPTAPLGPRKRIVVETDIRIQEGPTGSYSELHIRTKDRTGLLVDVVSTLKSLNVNVISAEVDTVGTEARQELLVTYHGDPLNDAMRETITNCLQYYLSLAEVERDESSPELCLKSEAIKGKKSFQQNISWSRVPASENDFMKSISNKCKNTANSNQVAPESALESPIKILTLNNSPPLKDLSNFSYFANHLVSPGLNRQFRLEFDSLNFFEFVGSGSFKTVYKGSWSGTDVAIVRMKIGGILQEARLLQHIPHHPNINTFYRWTVDAEGTEYAIMEFVPMGELSTVLRKHCSSITMSQKITMCAQICQAMKHLSSHNILHRDLAARNVLVKSLSPVTVKLADFGFAELTTGDDYPDLNQQCISSCLKLVPLRWIAPEIIKNQSWSEKSDVWAFGVTMWEIFSNGHEPYAAEFNSDFEVADYVLHGGHLQKPSNCPNFIYNIMCQCWKYKPNARPSFDELNLQFLKCENYYEAFEEDDEGIESSVEHEFKSDSISASKIESYAYIEELV
eukprot:g84.t1